MIDCMIAAVAWRLHVSLLAHDADMDRMASVIELRGAGCLAGIGDEHDGTAALGGGYLEETR